MGDIFGIGAVTQAAADFTATGLNYAAQKDYNQKYLQGIQETNYLNWLRAEEQNKWNKNERIEVQEYNDPLNQVKRLRRAGLSAAAAAQSAGNIPSVPMQSADLSNQQAPVPLTAPRLDFSGHNLIGLARSLEALKQDKIRTKDMELDYEFKPERLFTEQQLRNANFSLLRQKYEQEAELFPDRVQAIRYGWRKTRAEVLNTRVQRKILWQNYRTAVKEFGWIDKLHQADLNKAVQDLANSIKQGDILSKTGKGIDLDNANKAIKNAFEKYGGIPDNAAAKLAIAVTEGLITADNSTEVINALKEIGEYTAKGIWSSISDLATDIMAGNSTASDSVDAEVEAYIRRMKQGRKERKRKNKYSAETGQHTMGQYYEE